MLYASAHVMGTARMGGSPTHSGCDPTGETWEAAGLVVRLRSERLGGLCVVTDAAAAHLPRAQKPAGKPAAAGNSRPRRGRRKAGA